MRFIWKDPTSWTPLLRRTSGRRQTSATMVQAVSEIYDDLEVFHGARPTDVHSYYREGLRIADHDSLTESARRIFLSGAFPELDEEQFQAAVESLSRIDNRRLYVGLDDRSLLDECGHYLIYGSEHICSIAASLSRNGPKDYRQVLKRLGRPTLLRLSLPVSMASASDLLEFGALLLDWGRQVRAGRRPLKVDFTFTMCTNVPPSCVLGHEHPDILKDPLLPMQPNYRYNPLL